MDPNTLVWLLLISFHGGAAPSQCCATQAQVEIPSSIALPSCKKSATDDCTVSAYEVCKAIGEANKDAAFSVACIAKPK
jgi:hypothetical protein